MDLVTLQQARDHLRSDSCDDDEDLGLKISAASAVVLDYLGDAAKSWAEVTPVVVPARVQQAALLTVGWLYRERSGSQEFRVNDQFGYGYALPQGAAALLYSLRRPTVV